MNRDTKLDAVLNLQKTFFAIVDLDDAAFQEALDDGAPSEKILKHIASMKANLRQYSSTIRQLELLIKDSQDA